MASIDNSVSDGVSVVDITGTPLGIQLVFADKGSSTPTPHPFAQYEAFLKLPPSETTLLQTPLNQLGDKFWAQTIPKNSSQTYRDLVSAMISSGLNTQSPSGKPPYNISINVPQTGIMRAVVAQPPYTLLSYEVHGISASWSAHNTQIWPAPDASFQLTFDLAIVIQIDISPEPYDALAAAAWVDVGNANISPTNFTGDVESAFGSFLNFINEQPTNLFQVAEGGIDSLGAGVAPDLGDLSTLLADLTTAWHQALSYGFSQLTPVIQPEPEPFAPNALFLQFGHPQDPAPVVSNAADPAENLVNKPAISTSPEIQAGGSLAVAGTGFPLTQENTIYLKWDDTTSGFVTESDIAWGQVGGSTQPPVTISRHGADGKNQYVFSNLASNTLYQFSVRDQDLLTETPFSSPPLLVSTTTANLIDFSLVLSDQTMQDNWLWCKKCQALAFAGNSSLGACSGGGSHEHMPGANYVLTYDVTAAANQQSNWRWCKKCQVLAFAGGSSLGACAAGGSHEHMAGANYVLTYDLTAGANQQSNWRWCNKCQALAFAGNPSPGPCPAGGSHDHTGSGDYVLSYLTGKQTPLGIATLTTTGNFSARMTVPRGQAPGMYNLVAALNGTQLAVTPLQVVAAGKPLQPIITMPASEERIMVLSTFNPIFEGFPPGTVKLFVDSPSGQSIGTTTSSGTAQFTKPFVWPNTIQGQHNVYAQEAVGTQTLAAQCSVFIDPIPQ